MGIDFGVVVALLLLIVVVVVVVVVEVATSKETSLNFRHEIQKSQTFGIKLQHKQHNMLRPQHSPTQSTQTQDRQHRETLAPTFRRALLGGEYGYDCGRTMRPPHGL